LYRREALKVPSREELVWDPVVMEDLTEEEGRNIGRNHSSFPLM
jgi:hypothetical protein